MIILIGGKMPGRKWRFYENRMLRKFFNTERRLQEVQSGGGCDGHSDKYAIELAQHSIPEWIKQELGQAENDCGDGKLLPIAVIREKHKKDEDAFVIMRLSTFIKFS